MENKSIFSLFLSVIIVMSLVGLSIKEGYSQINDGTEVTANVTNNQALDPATAEVLNMTMNQNYDGRLDVQATLPTNETKVTRNGTLVVGDSQIPITYEQMGGLNIIDGDTLLASEVVNGRAAIDRFKTTEPWTNGEIPVVINSDVPDQQRIFDAMAYVQTTTPITFKPVDIDENGAILNSHYLRFVQAPANDDSCYTYAGMLSPEHPVFTDPTDPFYSDGNYHGQPVVVASWCNTAALVHELGHNLGLWHEQKRCDRDQYVEIVWSNIQREAWPQYQALCDPQRPAESPTSFGPYDYCSIMHYKRFSGFAVDINQPVINLRQNVVGCDEIGMAEEYSPTDIAAINSIYSFVQ